MSFLGGLGIGRNVAARGGDSSRRLSLGWHCPTPSQVEAHAQAAVAGLRGRLGRGRLGRFGGTHPWVFERLERPNSLGTDSPHRRRRPRRAPSLSAFSALSHTLPAISRSSRAARRAFCSLSTESTPPPSGARLLGGRCRALCRLAEASRPQRPTIYGWPCFLAIGPVLDGRVFTSNRRSPPLSKTTSSS